MKDYDRASELLDVLFDLLSRDQLAGLAAYLCGLEPKTFLRIGLGYVRAFGTPMQRTALFGEPRPDETTGEA